MAIEHLEKLHTLNISWSSMSSFDWNKEEWFDSYILGNKKTSPELEFGSYADKRIQNDPNFFPDMPRYEKMQHRMKIMLSGIPLVGVPDGIDLTVKNKKLADYKTGVKAWDYKRAKETGQLKFYLLLLYITEKIPPEEFDCFIHWLPTKKTETGDFKVTIEFIEEGRFETFTVKHTLQDILLFAGEIKKVYKEMEQFCLEYGSK